MSLKIIQVSDIHIRNLKYHREYRRVFENLYRKIDELKPDIVINTGDTAHTKTQISPELVEMASDHFRKIGAMVPYHIILGNHDMNLMNLDRQDAITPIINSIKSDNIFLHKKSGLAFTQEKDGQKYNFWVFSLADHDNYPTPSMWAAMPNDVNIGLFHGSVSTCVTDMNWRMTSVEHDLSIFDGLDFAMLGDIHKQQFFRERTIAYAGSLIQQNFGEELNKGFLMWELGAKGKGHKVKSHFLPGSRPFYTVKLDENLGIPKMDIEEGAHVRVSPPRPITLVEQKEIEIEVKKIFKPHDIITLSSNNIGEQRVAVGKKFSHVENLRKVHVQEKLIREFLKKKDIDEVIMEKILEMNRRFQIHIDQEDDGARNISWKIDKIGWSNLFNYGQGNVIDFSKLGGLIGVFAPNGSGKSNFIDVILETCFDATTKGINKNIFLINDNKEIATSIAEITANDQSYEIERNIERIKYGHRAGQAREWAKTSVSFSMIDSVGAKEPLVGTLRPETESNIRQRLGSFDDFMLTSLMAQWNPMDIIAAKETKRKEIIYRFLDLDIFGNKAVMAKDEARDYVRKLAELEDDEIEAAVERHKQEVKVKEAELKDLRTGITALQSEIKSANAEAMKLAGMKVKADAQELMNWAGEIKLRDIKIAAEEKKISDIQERLAVIETDLAKVLKLEQKFDVQMYRTKKQRHDELEKLIERQQVRIQEKQKALEVCQKDVSLLKEVPCGVQFPSCKFLVNAFESKNKLALHQVELSTWKAEVDRLTAEHDTLQADVDRLMDYERFVGEKDSLTSRAENLKLQIENIKLKINQLNAEKEKLKSDMDRYAKMEADISKNKTFDESIDLLEQAAHKNERMLKKEQEKLVEASRLLGSTQGIVQKLEAQLAEIKEVRAICMAYEHYIDAMGKDGIPYQILTQKLPLINEEINKILSNVADFGVFLEHDVEEQSIKFYIQYGQYKSRLLDLGSGAEKFLASIAIRNALLNISILPKTNMLIIDEGFGKLDPKNLEAIQLMFNYLKTVFDHVIVISHLDTMKDLVDNSIDITVDDEGYAHIEVGG